MRYPAHGGRTCSSRAPRRSGRRAAPKAPDRPAAALVAVALVAVLFALALRLILGGGDLLGADSVAVEFVNEASYPVQMVSIRCSGGTIEARELEPGESVSGRVWPSEVVRAGEPYECAFAIQLVGKGGKARTWRPRIAFSPRHHVPRIRWVLKETPYDPEALISEGMTDKPTPGYIRALRERMGR